MMAWLPSMLTAVFDMDLADPSIAAFLRTILVVSIGD